MRRLRGCARSRRDERAESLQFGCIESMMTIFSKFFTLEVLLSDLLVRLDRQASQATFSSELSHKIAITEMFVAPFKSGIDAYSAPFGALGPPKACLG